MHCIQIREPASRDREHRRGLVVAIGQHRRHRTIVHRCTHRSAPLHDDSTMLQQRHTGTGNGINHWQTQWKPQRRCYHRLPLSTTPVTVTHPIPSYLTDNPLPFRPYK